tara:strand:- start:2508 stop:3362 length:855 start_codon:yes stop_codon:yes gene_type:complete
VALLSLNTAYSQSSDPNFHIYIAFGQSNMEGFPGLEEKDKNYENERFQVYASVDFSELERQKGTWYTASAPLCRPNSGLSPADYFGRTLVENLPENIKVGIVSVAVAGSKIELFQKDNFQEYASTAPDWMEGIIKTYDGNPYQYLIDRAKEAQNKGVIKGILLHQGESNTGDEEWPEKVKGIYNNLLEDLNLNSDEVPLLAGEVVHEDQQGACASMNEIIGALPQTIPNSYVISSSGAPARRDRLHFTPEGYRILGTRYAVQILKLMGYDRENIKLPENVSEIK